MRLNKVFFSLLRVFIHKNLRTLWSVSYASYTIKNNNNFLTQCTIVCLCIDMSTIIYSTFSTRYRLTTTMYSDPFFNPSELCTSNRSFLHNILLSYGLIRNWFYNK